MGRGYCGSWIVVLFSILFLLPVNTSAQCDCSIFSTATSNTAFDAGPQVLMMILAGYSYTTTTTTAGTSGASSTAATTTLDPNAPNETECMDICAQMTTITTTTNTPSNTMNTIKLAAIVTFDHDGVPDDIFQANDRLRKGYQLAVDWINTQRGGIFIQGSWHPVDMYIYDNNANASTARGIAEHVINDVNFSFLFGPAGDNANDEISSVTHSSAPKTLTFLPACGNSTIFENRSMVYGLLPDAKRRTYPVFNLLNQSHPGHQSPTRADGEPWSFVFLEQTDDPTSVQECETLEYYANSTVPRMLKRAAQSITRDLNDPSNVQAMNNLSAWLEGIDADVVFMCVEPKICASMLTTFKDRNYNPRGISVSDSCIALLQTEGNYLFGISAWVPELNHTSSQYRFPSQGELWTSHSFTTAYTEFFAPASDSNSPKWQPNHESAAAFSAIEVLITAMEAADSMAPEDIKVELDRMKFETIFGPVQFDVKSENNATYKLVQKQSSGSYKIVSPIDEADAVVVFPKPTWSELKCTLENPEGTTDGEYSLYGFDSGRIKYGVAQTRTVLYQTQLLAAASYAADTLGMNAGTAVAAANMSWRHRMLSLNLPTTSGLPNFVHSTPVECPITDVGTYCIYTDAMANFTSSIFRSIAVTRQALAREAMLNYLRTVGDRYICGPCMTDKVATFRAEKEGTFTTYTRQCNYCSVSLNEVPVAKNGNYLLRECESQCNPGEGKEPGTIECLACPPGKNSIISQCRNCSIGRYSSASRTTQCAQCDAGKFADQTGQSKCLLCSEGREAQTKGAAVCSNCSRGTIAPHTGTSACMLCPTGSIASDVSMTQCETCFPGSYSAWGAKICNLCQVGRYQNRPNRSSCNDGTTGATFDDIGLVKGNNSFQYWTHHEGHFLKWEFCGHVPDACLEYEVCLEGSTGIQCSACLPDYFVPSFTSTESCIKCPALHWNLAVTFLGMSLIICAALLFARLAVTSIKRPNDLHVPLLKILIHWGFMCGIFALLLRNLVFLHRETLNENIAAFTLWGCWLFMEAFMGKPWLETSTWSINCIFQRAEEGLADTLGLLTHSDWFRPEYQADIRKLKTAHEDTESDMVIFWLLVPFIVMGVTYVFSVLYMSIYFFTHSGTLAEANQFYNDLLNEQQGAKYVKENYDERSLQPYFDLYKSRVLGIWWPFNYLSAAHKRQGCCYRRRTFGSESQPVCMSVLLLMYGMVIVSIMRPRDCTKFGSSKPRMIAASTIVCDQEESEDLFWWSTFGCVVWGVFFPIVAFCMVQIGKSKLMHEDWWKEENSVLIIGYNAKCFWWESIVFFDKFLLSVVAHSGLEDDHQILLQFMLVIFFGCFTTAWKPFDKRCHNLLWKVQVVFIIIRVFLCIALEFVLLTDNDFGWLVAIAVVIIANLWFLAYVFYLIWYYGSTSFIQSQGGGSDNLSWLKIVSVDEEPQLGPIARLKIAIKDWINAQHIRAQQTQPYACFDHLLGWVTIVGSRSDLAYPTQIHRGNRCQNRYGMTALSDAPDVPTKSPQIVPEKPIVKAASEHKRYLQEAVAEVMQHIATGLDKTFSVSLLEFIIRSGIFFAVKFSDDRKLKLEDEEKELDEVIVKLTMDESFERATTAHNSNAFLSNMSDTMAHKVSAMSTSGRVKKGSHLHKLQKHQMDQNEEEDVNSTELTLELFADEIKHRPRRNRKDRHDHQHASLEIASATHSAAGQAIRQFSKAARSGRRSLRGFAAGTYGKKPKSKVDSDHVRMRTSEIVEGIDTQIPYPKNNDEAVPKSKRRQLSQWVEDMMQPMLYCHGVRLETLQQGMLRLQTMKTNEIKYMIDKFEEAWVKHNYTKAIILKRYGNQLQDTAVQCDFDNPKEEIRPDNAQEIICEELKFGDYAEKVDTPETLEKQHKAALKWARLAIMFGHTLSQFSTKELVRAVKQKRDSICIPLVEAVDREKKRLDILKQYLNDKRGITTSAKTLEAPPSQFPPLPPPREQPPTGSGVSNETIHANF